MRESSGSYTCKLDRSETRSHVKGFTKLLWLCVCRESPVEGLEVGNLAMESFRKFVVFCVVLCSKFCLVLSLSL
jgi:hypothetical protein